MKLLIALAAHAGVAAWVTRELRDIRRQVVKLHGFVNEITQPLHPFKHDWAHPYDTFSTPEEFNAALAQVRALARAQQ